MVEAARGEGLDWFVLTDHGAGPTINHVLMAHQEALPLSEPGRFAVIPGEEFTTPNYHANIINGTVLETPATPLQQVIEAVLKADSDEHPITIKLNHPHWSGTPKTPELARQLEKLPLIEVWNDGGSDEVKKTISLWWEMLNRGVIAFAAAGTDSHNRKSARLGHRRTYVYLGDKPLTAANIVKALREGRSFLSPGTLVLFTADGILPGGTVSSTPIRVKVWAQSVSPIDRIEIVLNGEVIHSFAVGGKTEFSVEMDLAADNGWSLVQVFREGDPIPVAMTNTIFIRIKEQR